MKVLWLGQGGLLFVSGKTKIMIDPYLTNSLSLLDYNLDRQMKINKKLFAVKPSVIVLTNCHPDHADPKTIERFAKKLKKKLVILSCESVFGDMVCEKHIEGCKNFLFEPGSEWTVDNVTISAVCAKTDDRSAFGVIITDNETGKKYYVAGDTLYNKYVLQDLPDDIYAAFIPINGEYGSMNIADAKRFAKAIDPRFVIPIHFGMFDKIDPTELKLINAIIPKIYRIIDFEKWSSNVPMKKSLDRRFNEKPELEVQEEFEIPTDEPTAPFTYEIEEPVIDEASEVDAEEIDVDVDVAEATIEGEEEIPTEEVFEEEFPLEEIPEEEVPVEEEIPEEEEVPEEEEIPEEEEVPEEEEIPEEEYDEDFEDEEDEDAPSSYTARPSNDDEDDADKIDAFIRELERFERGEDIDDK